MNDSDGGKKYRPSRRCPRHRVFQRHRLEAVVSTKSARDVGGNTYEVSLAQDAQKIYW